MSVAWYIVLERPIPDFDHRVNGKALSRAGEQLEILARQLGLESLMNFFSAPAEGLVAFAADHGVNPAGNPLPEHWFSAEAGLKTVRVLIQAIDRSELSRKDQLLADLREFENVLSSAEKHGVGWHLAVDF